jgi:hypothetical protein
LTSPERRYGGLVSKRTLPMDHADVRCLDGVLTLDRDSPEAWLLTLIDAEGVRCGNDVSPKCPC